MMTQQFDVAQKLGKGSFDTAVKTLELTSASTKAIVVETADYAKKSLEQSTATFQKLAGVKSLDKAIEIQTDYFKSAYEGFVAHSTKTRELYTKLAQDSLAPFGALRSAAEAAIVPAKAAARAK
ncbi:phasin family protein [Microvirga aerophila]|nr:phasin family protein [Microvirga aerophila]